MFMNIKNFKDFVLNEGKNDIKTKWLSDKNFYNILTKDNDKLLNRLINLDPTSKLDSDKIGKYVSWLIVLFRRGDSTLKQILSYDNMEDDYKVIEALTFFDKNKNLFNKKDINQYKNLDELFDSIVLFDDVSSNVVQKSDKYLYYKELDKSGRIEFFYENNNWLIIIPNDEEISNVIAGTKTSWCTAKSKNSLFNTYNNIGKLYIFLDKKKNLYPTYQLHIKNGEFQDNKSKNIKPSDFFENNLDIFKKIFSNLIEKINNDQILSKNEKKWLPKSILDSYLEKFLNTNNTLYSIFNNIINGEISTEDAITEDLLGFPFKYDIVFDDDFKKTFEIKSNNIYNDLEEAFDIDNGVLQYVDGWADNNYAYGYASNDDFDDDEYNYMFNYLNDDVKEKLNYLKKIFYYNQSIENDTELYNFLYKFKLNSILETYSSEFSYMKNEAKHKKAKSIVNEWGFEITNNDSIIFDIVKILPLVKDNIDSSNRTLFDILIESKVLNISYEWEYEIHNYEDNTDLNNSMLVIIESIINDIESGDSKYLISLYIYDIYPRLEEIGFTQNNKKRYFYENDYISTEIINVPMSNEYNIEEQTKEEFINNCKLEIIFIDKTKNTKSRGFIKFQNISKYLQPMLF